MQDSRAMRRPPALIAIILALSATAAPVACGGEAEQGAGPPARTITDDASDLAPADPPPEDADPLPDLPGDWRREINEGAGFAIGLPPGWSARPSPAGQGSVLTSPDRLVVLSISADRTSGALGLPLGQFARRTAEALGTEVAGAQRFRRLSVGRPAPFAHRYDAVAVRALGTPGGSEVRERLLVAVIRREGHAVYVAIVRANASQPSQYADRATVKQVLRSLRGRPPQ